MNSPLIGTVFRITVAPGDQVRAAQEIIIVESMKMEHPVEAGVDGVVESVLVAEGETIAAGQVLVRITPGAVTASNDSAPVDSTSGERADLARRPLDPQRPRQHRQHVRRQRRSSRGGQRPFLLPRLPPRPPLPPPYR